MSSVEIAGAIEAVSLRSMWTVLSMAYFGFATVLVMSRHDYPVWTWSIFYVVSITVLVFFNINYYEVAPVILTIAEVLLWAAAILAGTFFFTVLLLIGDDIDSGLMRLPALRELPTFLWRWATGGESMMDIGFAVCADCGHICRANISEDGSVRPLGIGECPDCGHGEWKELIDAHKNWVTDEE